MSTTNKKNFKYIWEKFENTMNFLSKKMKMFISNTKYTQKI